ncbi:MAG: hypothetical protein ACKO44_03120, partial [Algoriphagus sp.]
MSKPQLTHFINACFIFALPVLLISCKKEEPVDLRITTLSKEEIALQAEAARKSVTPILAAGLKMEVWGTDS